MALEVVMLKESSILDAYTGKKIYFIRTITHETLFRQKGSLMKKFTLTVP